MPIGKGNGNGKQNGKQNCPFCDSARHGPLDCKSTINGKYKKLFETMVEKECPHFHSYNIKELKRIAFDIPYENNLAITKFPRNISKNNKEFKINPIPLTLSKTRMIKALTRRWETLVECRNKFNHGIDNPEEYEDECPICYDTMTYKWWSDLKLTWSMEYNSGTIKTTCNHKFCNKCWDKIPKDCLRNRSYNNFETKKCPMCRSNVNCDDVLEWHYG
jgi:hypothetical protein|tara:strand:+ start:713 stop:1366 length:654 start_codon:yes stop_codon:yes gene_type:complete